MSNTQFFYANCVVGLPDGSGYALMHISKNPAYTLMMKFDPFPRMLVLITHAEVTTLAPRFALYYTILLFPYHS